MRLMSGLTSTLGSTLMLCAPGLSQLVGLVDEPTQALSESRSSSGMSLSVMSGETLMSGETSIDCAPGLSQFVGANDDPTQTLLSWGKGMASTDADVSSKAASVK